jgi:conjugative transfer signal peptidase TraF
VVEATIPADPPRRRVRTTWLAVTGALAIVLLTAGRHAPLVVWNASASSPRGLYVVTQAAPQLGDYVLARAPEAAERLAAARGYVPGSVPLVKSVAARTGQRVCASGDRLTVDGRGVALRRRVDRAGRRLPRWSGCRTLVEGELLLLGRDNPASFDSRYFGPVRAERILGRARLVWRA